jgi:transposase-like protein
MATATRLGVGWPSVEKLYVRWRIRGRGALVARTRNRSYSFEFKREVVRRFLAGETQIALAKEFDLSSPNLVQSWVRKSRDEGESALMPRQDKHRPEPHPDTDPGAGPEADPETAPGTDDVRPGEVEQLRAENERLRAEVAFLGKLRALRAQERQ